MGAVNHAVNALGGGIQGFIQDPIKEISHTLSDRGVQNGLAALTGSPWVVGGTSAAQTIDEGGNIGEALKRGAINGGLYYGGQKAIQGLQNGGYLPSWMGGSGGATELQGPPAEAANGFVGPPASAAGGGGLLGSLGSVGSAVAANPNLVKTGLGLLGGALGGNGNLTGASNSSTTSRDPYLTDLMHNAINESKTIYDQQKQNGGLNEMQRQGIEMQKAALNDPKYLAPYDQMRTQAQGLLGTQQAGNPFTAPGGMAQFQPQNNDYLRSIMQKYGFGG